MEYFVKVEDEEITELYGCQDGITVNFDGNSWSMSGMKYKTLVTSPEYQRIDQGYDYIQRCWPRNDGQCVCYEYA